MSINRKRARRRRRHERDRRKRIKHERMFRRIERELEGQRTSKKPPKRQLWWTMPKDAVVRLTSLASQPNAFRYAVSEHRDAEASKTYLPAAIEGAKLNHVPRRNEGTPQEGAEADR